MTIGTTQISAHEQREIIAEKLMKWRKDMRSSGREMWVDENGHGVAYADDYLTEDRSSMIFKWNPVDDVKDWTRAERVLIESNLWEGFMVYLYLVHGDPKGWNDHTPIRWYASIPTQKKALALASLLLSRKY